MRARKRWVRRGERRLAGDVRPPEHPLFVGNPEHDGRRRRYGHYEDAVSNTSWAEARAREAEASEPGSDKARELAKKAQEAKADFRLRRQELRKLKQDLCDTFPEDKEFAKRLDEEFPVTAEPEPEKT